MGRGRTHDLSFFVPSGGVARQVWINGRKDLIKLLDDPVSVDEDGTWGQHILQMLFEPGLIVVAEVFPVVLCDHAISKKICC